MASVSINAGGGEEVEVVVVATRAEEAEVSPSLDAFDADDESGVTVSTKVDGREER